MNGGLNMYYEFTDDCLTGIETIDNEHRELFRIINDLQDLLLNDMSENKYDRTQEMLKRLHNYAEEHFRHEEEYMASINDPELEMQKKQHLDFCNKINQADATIPSDGQDEFLQNLLKFLVTWLYRHIIGSDLMIGKRKQAGEQRETVKFTDEFMTGIPLIDEEHKELFRIIDEVQTLIRNDLLSDRFDEILSLLGELTVYAASHFKDEEEYMRSINYAGLDAQKRAHDAFVARIEELDIIHIDSNQQGTLEEILDFLTEWLVNHILFSDKKIGYKV
ncbi:MAG: hemerythrin family protein [Lachnospiraceae bacterium]|nr:hemerythrin family protein [Lachnospiraceae bacterium]